MTNTIGALIAIASLVHQCRGQARVNARTSPRYRFDFGEITRVAYGSLAFDLVADFESFDSSCLPGEKYEEVLRDGDVRFAERFEGQILNVAMDFDILADSPLNPLRLAPGRPNENLAIVSKPAAGRQLKGKNDNNVLSGTGPLKYPKRGASGFGSISALFDNDQKEIGFRLIDPDAGAIMVQFFRRNGVLIDFFVVQGYTEDTTLGFRREGGVSDIAGFSIYHTDPEGIGIDDLRYHSGPKPPTESPTPGKGSDDLFDDDWYNDDDASWDCNQRGLEETNIDTEVVHPRKTVGSSFEIDRRKISSGCYSRSKSRERPDTPKFRESESKD